LLTRGAETGAARLPRLREARGGRNRILCDEETVRTRPLLGGRCPNGTSSRWALSERDHFSVGTILSITTQRAPNRGAATRPSTPTAATASAKIVVAAASPTSAARNPAPMAGTDMNT